jgi:hypothetical protein
LGIGLLGGGLAVATVGIATSEKNISTGATQATIEFTGTGGAIAAVGIFASIAGVPLMIIGSKKKKNAQRSYLRQYESNTGFEDLAPQRSPRLEVHSNGLAFVF